MTDTDHRLHSKVDDVGRLVAQVQNNLLLVGEELSSVSSTQQQTVSELAQLRADFLEFTSVAERRAHVQRAETRIGVLQDQLEHQFGHYKVVRRTAIGMLEAFDLGLVSEETTRSVSEQLMIQTPRYWLAPALVGLAAWIGDDRELCDRAITEAFRRDPGKTSLLFSLVLRRQKRSETSLRWLRSYLSSQDPLALGGDFAVILETTAAGAFGPAARALVNEVLTGWDASLGDDAARDEQVGRWVGEVERHAAPPSTAYPALASVSPQWPTLDRVLGAAQGNERLLQHYRDVMAGSEPPAARVEDALDDILDRLVSEFDAEELPLQRELAHSSAVVATDGDLDAARLESERTAAALESTLDYLTIQSLSALEPAAVGVSPATQRMAVGACRSWFASAHRQCTAAYRAHVPGDVRAVFAGDHNTGAAVFSLPRWDGSFITPLPDLERDLSDHWSRHGQPFVDSLAYPIKRAVVVPALLLAVAMAIAFSINPGFGLLVTVVMGGIWGYVLYQRHRAGLAAQTRAQELLGTWREESLRQLRDARADLTEWNSAYEGADAADDDVRAFIESLAQSTSPRISYERRDVHLPGGTS